MKYYFLLMIALIIAGFAASSAHAQEPTPSDDAVNAIARQLYCPVCENTPLDVCPTEACRQWRSLIREQLADGWTEAQIKQYFVDNYGARVLAEPPRSGFNWLAYILPPVIILVGAFGVLRGLRTWANASKAPAAVREAHPMKDDEYAARLEEELRKRE